MAGEARGAPGLSGKRPEFVEDILAKALGQDIAKLQVSEKRDLLVRLLSRLAHEIRNPLSSLDIHIQLLEEDLGTLAPEAGNRFNPRLQIIHGELHRLEGIVERFLRLAGPSALELEPVEPDKVVAHVCDLLRPDAATRQIEIVSDIEPNLPTIPADPLRLTQALLNVVINAVQAIHQEGRVRIRVARLPCGDAVEFTVEDNGPGIPPDKLTEIFDPYFTTKEEGSGLGLWIAQQIAMAHGGSLAARNVEPRGARFALTLPLLARGKCRG